MTAIVPSVPVADIDGCVEFYRTVLGFELIKFTGRGADASAVIRLGGVELIFRSHAGMRGQVYEASTDPASRIVLHFLVPDAERLYRRVVGHALIVRDYSLSLFGGHEFAVEDPNGLILLFRQQVAAERLDPEAPLPAEAGLDADRLAP